MPFANAAFAALVVMRLPTTQASLTPPSVRTNEIAIFPGASREPDSMAAIVSSTWCLVFSATGAGSGLRSAEAMYRLSSRITGETWGAVFTLTA